MRLLDPKDWLVTLIVFTIAICIGGRGIFVKEDAAIRTLEAHGYSSIQIGGCTRMVHQNKRHKVPHTQPFP